jgi:hypothetical protein
MLPHTAVGIGVIVFFCWTMLSILFSTGVTGQLERVERHKSKNGYSYWVYYQYDAGGGVVRDSTTISFEEYQRWTAPAGPEGPATKPVRGQPVELQQYRLGSWRTSWRAADGAPWGKAIFLFLWGVMWNGFVGLFLYQAWWVPLRARWLVKHGIEVRGRVTHKRWVGQRRPTHFVGYEYVDASGRHQKAEMVCAKTELRMAVRQEDPVTVLVHPRKGKRSVVYELCEYEAV